MLVFTPNCPVRPRGLEPPQSRARPGLSRSWWKPLLQMRGRLLPSAWQDAASLGRGSGCPMQRGPSCIPRGWLGISWVAARAHALAWCMLGTHKRLGAPAAWGMGRTPPQPGGAHPRGDSVEQEWTCCPQARRAESSSDAHHSAFNRIKLNFKGRRRPRPHPCSLCRGTAVFRLAPAGSPGG